MNKPISVGAQFPLPPVDDGSRVCVSLRIPGDEISIANFVGALMMLARWNNYLPDPSGVRKNKPTADIWRDIVMGLSTGNCSQGAVDDMLFRQNGCKLEYALNCDGPWTVLYDPSNCFDNSTEATGEITVGECKTVMFRLFANSYWRAGYAVKAGYTIEVLSAVGHWDDGTIAWFCPDGIPFGLGICLGDFTLHEDDPAPTLPHASVIMKIGENYYGSWQGEVHGVDSAETELVPLDFMMNDVSMGDNAGWIDLKVKICNQEEPPVYDFDLVPIPGIEGVTVERLTDLSWHVTTTYNNSPTVGDQPVTSAQVKLVDIDGNNVGSSWQMTNLTGWADVAGYTNNGAIYTDVYPAGGAAVPTPTEPGYPWDVWFNTYYATPIYAIDCRSTVASTALEFDITITLA